MMLVFMKIAELRIILNRTTIGKSVSSVRPQVPIPPEGVPLPPVSAPASAQNVGIVQEATHRHHQPLNSCGNEESRHTENFPVLPPPTRVEQANQSQLPYWVNRNRECAAGSCMRRDIQIKELIESLQRMNIYMRGLQGKIRRLEDERKRFQSQLSSSNAEKEKLRNDAAKMERELLRRDQSELLFLKVQQAVDNLREEFQLLNVKVEDALKKVSGAMMDCQGLKDLGKRMEDVWRKLEQIDEKMEQREEAGKSSRLVFKGVVTTVVDCEESSSEYHECCSD